MGEYFSLSVPALSFSDFRTVSSEIFGILKNFGPVDWRHLGNVDGFSELSLNAMAAATKITILVCMTNS